MLKNFLLAAAAVVVSALLAAAFFWFFYGSIHPCEFAKRKVVRMLSADAAKPDFATVAGAEMFFRTSPAPYDCLRFLLDDGADTAPSRAAGEAIPADEYFGSSPDAHDDAAPAAAVPDGEAVTADEFFSR